MILHTSAHCITDPPCEWVGTTDKSAEKHVRETGHATVTVTIPVTERGILIRNESGPTSVCAPTGPGPIPDLAGEDVAT